MTCSEDIEKETIMVQMTYMDPYCSSIVKFIIAKERQQEIYAV